MSKLNEEQLEKLVRLMNEIGYEPMQFTHEAAIQD